MKLPPACEAIVTDGADRYACLSFCYLPRGKFFLCAAHSALADAGQWIEVRLGGRSYMVMG